MAKRNKLESEPLQLGLLTQSFNNPDELKKATEARQALARAREAAKSQAAPVAVSTEPPAAAAEVIPFPGHWAEEQRGVPNICLRSALFSVVERGKRRYLENELIAAQDGYGVRYTGKQLDQADLDVWQQAVHLCRNAPIGEKVYFSVRAFLRAIGRNDGKSDREWLQRSLARMVVCGVTLEHGRRKYMDNMLGWGIDEDTGQMYLRINRDLAQFFERDQYTLIDFERRLSLDSQVAKWLHDYYSSHAKPHPVSVEKLRELCGSQAETLRKFRQELKKALAELVQAGLLIEWEIDQYDRVQVKKRPSASQGRHLIRKAVKQAVKSQPKRRKKDPPK